MIRVRDRVSVRFTKSPSSRVYTGRGILRNAECGKLSAVRPPVKCGSADLRIFKRVKCGWFC